SIRRSLPSGMLVAGKTGTTNDNSDVWFIGMTPGLVAGVWLGFDRPHSIAPGAAGGTLAAPIWARMMAAYEKVGGVPRRSRPGGPSDSTAWARPDWIAALELDRETGAVADSATSPTRRYLEYFLPGTEPGLVHVWAPGVEGLTPDW